MNGSRSPSRTASTLPRLVRSPDVLDEPVGGEDVVADLAAEVDGALARLVRSVLRVALLELLLVELGLQHLERHGPVLVLAALGPADDVDGRVGQVLQPDRRLDLVHVLPPLASGAHRRDLQVLLVDLDVDVLVAVGRHLDRRERRLTGVVRVEWAHAHQPVHADLRAEVAVRGVARDRERHVVDPRLVPLLEVDDLGLVAAPLAPAHVHAQQHLRPVLGVGAAGAGLDVHDGVGAVGRAGQHAPELGRAHPGRERRQERLGLGNDGRVVLARSEVEEHLGVLDVPPELLERGERLLEPGALAGHHLRLLRVVPEAGRQRRLAEALDLALQPVGVKGAPLAP